MTYNGKLLNLNLGLESCVGIKEPVLIWPHPILDHVIFHFLFLSMSDSVRMECNLKKSMDWDDLLSFWIEFWLKWIDSCVFLFLPKESSILFELKIKHLKLHIHSFLCIKDKTIITMEFSIRIYLKFFIEVLFSYEEERKLFFSLFK